MPIVCKPYSRINGKLDADLISISLVLLSLLDELDQIIIWISDPRNSQLVIKPVVRSEPGMITICATRPEDDLDRAPTDSGFKLRWVMAESTDATPIVKCSNRSST